MHRVLLGLLIACSHPIPAPISTPPPAPADAPVADASPDAAVVTTYLAPPPLPLEPATPPSPTCLASPELHETARAIAALDAELRRHGGMVLRPHGGGRGEIQLGAIRPGPHGERQMVVGALHCGMPMPTIAIDASGEVFTPEIVLKPQATRRAASCQLPCGGCGANMPPTAMVVEVPANAHFGPARAIDVPIDVQLTFSYPKDARCMPRP